MTKTDIYREGPRGQMVRVYPTTHRGEPVYRVEYRTAGGKRAAHHQPRTAIGRAQAVAFAKGIIEERGRPDPLVMEQAPVTIDQMFRQFEAEVNMTLRPNTIRIYRESWARFATWYGGHEEARNASRAHMVALRTHLDAKGLAPNTIRRVFVTVRHLFRWAEDAGLIPTSTVLRYVYKVGKDREREPVPEYSSDEAVSIITKVTAWRPRLALTVIRNQGVRQHAALHLTWADVDFATDTVTWCRAWDKMGREWTQPLRSATRAALLERRAMVGGEGATGWVLPSDRDPETPYTIQSFWAALKRAEKAAGVAYRPGRAGHGFRRLLAGDVNQLTGNAKMAMDAIGDRDMDQLPRYVLKRDAELRKVFAELDAE